MIDKMIFEHNPRHSGFQIEHFMIGGHSTKYGCYRQALRELFSRLSEVQRIQDKPSISPEDAHLCREFCHIYLIAESLRGQLGKKLENIEDLERDYWVNRLQDEAVLELVSENRVSKATLQSIHRLPVVDRLPVLKRLSDQHERLGLIDEFKNRLNIVPSIDTAAIEDMSKSIPTLLSEAKILIENHHVDTPE